jgi:uncharacterized membrane protein (DUF2068 family)
MCEHRSMGAGVTHPVHHHHEPAALDAHTSSAGLRTVAGFEAAKGIGVILLAVILILVHKHAEDFAEHILFGLHIDVDRKFGEAVMNAALKVSDARLITILAAAAVYSSVRFVEAWGLWHRRVWAEWFAMLSGLMYLPWEILKIIERVDWERVGLLAVNICIIVYMVSIRIRESGWYSRRQPENVGVEDLNSTRSRDT